MNVPEIEKLFRPKILPSSFDVFNETFTNLFLFSFKGIDYMHPDLKFNYVSI